MFEYKFGLKIFRKHAKNERLIEAMSNTQENCHLLNCMANHESITFIGKMKMMEDSDLRPLTEEEVKLLKQTFKAIDTDKVAMRFYSRLFVEYPEVKSMFPNDLTVLSSKIVSVFELIVFSFQNDGKGNFSLHAEVIRPLRSLGELHRDKGVADEYYPKVNEIFLQSLKIEAPAVFTASIETAWKLALNHLTHAMLTDVI